MQPSQRPTRTDVSAFLRPRRAGARVLLASTVALAMVPTLTTVAYADRDDRAFPSKEEVAAAEEQVQSTAQQVGAIKASLMLANQELEAAAVEAEKASEAFNGAMWRLEVAREELAQAREDAAAARRTVAEQRDSIGALVAASFRRGGQLTALNAVMSADGPEGVLDQYAAFQGVSGSLQADYDRFVATDVMAQGFEDRAQDASAKAERLAQEARVAKERAAAAAGAAQATAARIASEKDRLIRELARAQNISVSLARERQAALEELARKRAEARARAEAAEVARQQAREDARRAEEQRQVRAEARAEAQARAQREERQRKAAQARQESRDAAPEQRTRTPREEPRPTPQQPVSPPPAAAPPPPPPPGGSGGAERAISFAKSQLGDPYVWGAAGPDSWDCSGLMLAAWGQAGVYLPHYSVAQYYAGTPISAGDLRPGDLVFWGSSSSPESIHHVAMYIGGGQIIHAPRTGRPVVVESMYYWIPPNFFARV